MHTIDRRTFIASLGGAAAVQTLSHEARADALEAALGAELNKDSSTVASPKRYPTVADIKAEIPTRQYRRGVGAIFINTVPGGKEDILPPMPAAPTLANFFVLRFQGLRNHCLQSANEAMKRGADEQTILACLLHDIAQELVRSDHGYWGAQLFEPYVPERTAFAIKYHQALRFYPDPEAGYAYPDLYRELFGEDYQPSPHVVAAYQYARQHRWYGAARLVTLCDLYSFDPNTVVPIEKFSDIVGRHFKQPKEGLGNDGSPVAHMWRTLADPDIPL